MEIKKVFKILETYSKIYTIPEISNQIIRFKEVKVQFDKETKNTVVYKVFSPYITPSFSWIKFILSELNLPKNAECVLHINSEKYCEFDCYKDCEYILSIKGLRRSTIERILSSFREEVQ